MTTTRYLIIDKVNEVYLKIEAEADIRRELGEYFTFEVPGFKFMPQYRNRVWDGKIRLFSYATGKIYAGLYPYIINWCKQNDVQIVDMIKNNEEGTLKGQIPTKLNRSFYSEYGDILILMLIFFSLLINGLNRATKHYEQRL